MGFLITSRFIHTVGVFIGKLASSSRWHTITLHLTGAAMTVVGTWFVMR